MNTTTAQSAFDTSTSKWYDALIDYVRATPIGAAEADLFVRILHVTHRTPTRRNFIVLRNEVAKIASVTLRNDMLATIDSVMARKFHDTFALHFSRSRKDSSAAGEVFSLIGQAISYDEANDTPNKALWLAGMKFRGLNKPLGIPQFAECGCCSMLHPVGFNGDCRDDSNRFAAGQLNEIIGPEFETWEIV